MLLSPQRMNPRSFGDPLAPPSGQNFHLSATNIKINQADFSQIECRYSCSPENLWSSSLTLQSQRKDTIRLKFAGAGMNSREDIFTWVPNVCLSPTFMNSISKSPETKGKIRETGGKRQNWSFCWVLTSVRGWAEHKQTGIFLQTHSVHALLASLQLMYIWYIYIGCFQQMKRVQCWNFHKWHKAKINFWLFVWTIDTYKYGLHKNEAKISQKKSHGIEFPPNEQLNKHQRD